MAIKRKSILVAGGAGLIGSHLCRELLDRGHQVVCLDSFFTGDEAHIADLVGRPCFRVVRHDICNPLPLGMEFDEIYNLACPASPVHYQVDPVHTTKTSVIGSLHLLEAARGCGAKILLASTSEVYGDPEVHPQPESYHGNVNPIGPRACYDEGKRCAETLFFSYLEQHGVEIKVARIFNTYGPHLHPEDGRVVSNFILQALQGEDLTLYGKGAQTRSFCYVADTVAGLIALMESECEVTGPVNIGNPHEITVRELAELILELTNSGSKLIYLPMPKDDPKRRKPDISRAEQQLDWQPSTPLRQGLEHTIRYFESLVAQKIGVRRKAA